jgi:hypothetical protein
MAAKLTGLIHKIAIQLYPMAELYHLQFLPQAASPETFWYNLERDCFNYEVLTKYG